MDSSAYREKVGRNILKARQKAKLTQAEAAKKAGMNTNYFAVVERGEVNLTIDTLKKVSEALNISISELTK